MAAALVDLPARPDVPARRPARSSISTQRRWQGELLHPGEYVICADEKTQIQARQRDATRRPPPAPGPPGSASSTSIDRGGALCLPGRLGRPPRPASSAAASHKTGIVAVRPARRAGHDRRALRVRQARVLDRRQRLRHTAARARIDRLQAAWPNLHPRPPAGPRLLAQPDRDLLLDHPAQGPDPQRLHRPRGAPPHRLDGFEHHHHQIATPFAWTFSRRSSSATRSAG